MGAATIRRFRPLLLPARHLINPFNCEGARFCLHFCFWPSYLLVSRSRAHPPMSGMETVQSGALKVRAFAYQASQLEKWMEAVVRAILAQQPEQSRPAMRW